MSVVVETTLGDVTIDLYTDQHPHLCQNFLKLCRLKYYNFSLFHTVQRGFIAQTGDPTGERTGGESIHSLLGDPNKRYFRPEPAQGSRRRIRHDRLGLVSFVGDAEGLVGSQFFVTLGDDLRYLDGVHWVFGEVVEGMDVVELFNTGVICDKDHRPYKDVRVTHTVVLDDPYPEPEGFSKALPSRSPSPSQERLQGGRIAADEDVTEDKPGDMMEVEAAREAKARATILEMVGDIPDAEMAPPENVLFVCKLNPVTTDADLEIIFSRFGAVVGCEVIRDPRSQDSLQYAFVEFGERRACEAAYFHMDNVLVDERRIHVDFSQSVARVRWRGKGKGITGGGRELGQGRYEKSAGGDKGRRDQQREERKQATQGRERDRDRDDHRKRDDNWRQRDKTANESSSQRRDRDDRRHHHREKSPEKDRRDYSKYDSKKDSKKDSNKDSKYDSNKDSNKEKRYRDHPKEEKSHKKSYNKYSSDEDSRSNNSRQSSSRKSRR